MREHVMDLSVAFQVNSLYPLPIEVWRTACLDKRGVGIYLMASCFQFLIKVCHRSHCLMLMNYIIASSKTFLPSYNKSRVRAS